MADDKTAPAEEAPAEAPAEPELTPEQQAASDAHTATNEAEAGWSGKIEARLAAIEEHLGIGASADTDDNKETS